MLVVMLLPLGVDWLDDVKAALDEDAMLLEEEVEMAGVDWPVVP